MDIGLVDVDGGKNFPNIPLMKISAYHKQQGDSVEWADPIFAKVKTFEEYLKRIKRP